ncbi:MAG: hypothetical protein QY322_00230 [bacterium]|nr:MAG: hypothetical protein QY322_00230 [bacterium]
MKIKPFTLVETKLLAFIFLVLFVVIGFNMSISLRRGRDATRKNDISAIQKGLDTYYQKYRIYPQSTSDGKMIGCFTEEAVTDILTGLPLNVEVCNWGESNFEGMSPMPRDPSDKKGVSYKYVSDEKSYGFYVSLEGKDEPEYNLGTQQLGLQCGTKVCNYGRVVENEI